MALMFLHSVKGKGPKILIAALKNKRWVSPQRWNTLCIKDWMRSVSIYKALKSFNYQNLHIKMSKSFVAVIAYSIEKEDYWQ